MKHPSITKEHNTKTVQVIARVEFKEDPRKVVYLVRPSSGVGQYETSLFDGRATSCNCPAKGKCYHRIGCEELEKKRIVLKVGERVVSGVTADHAVAKALRLVAPLDVVAQAEAIVASAFEKDETHMNGTDLSATQHIIEQQVAAYELKLAAMDIDALKRELRKLGLAASPHNRSGVKLNASKDVMRDALARRRRHVLEHEAEVAALEALPDLPTTCPRDAVSCDALCDADELLDSGERAAVYLAEERTAVIEAPRALPHAPKFENDLGQHGALHSAKGFSFMR
jgi:hypothetical protein